MKWGRHAAQSSVFKTFTGKTSFGRWDDNIKMYLKGMCYENVDWLMTESNGRLSYHLDQ
jgi:hypothetical protein